MEITKGVGKGGMTRRFKTELRYAQDQQGLIFLCYTVIRMRLTTSLLECILRTPTLTLLPAKH